VEGQFDFTARESHYTKYYNSGTVGTSHPPTLSNIGIPLDTSVSAGFAVGLARR